MWVGKRAGAACAVLLALAVSLQLAEAKVTLAEVKKDDRCGDPRGQPLRSRPGLLATHPAFVRSTRPTTCDCCWARSWVACTALSRHR